MLTYGMLNLLRFSDLFLYLRFNLDFSKSVELIAMPPTGLCQFCSELFELNYKDGTYFPWGLDDTYPDFPVLTASGCPACCVFRDGIAYRLREPALPIENKHIISIKWVSFALDKETPVYDLPDVEHGPFRLHLAVKVDLTGTGTVYVGFNIYADEGKIIRQLQ
jgi:hypothetical protein